MFHQNLNFDASCFWKMIKDFMLHNKAIMPNRKEVMKKTHRLKAR